MSALFFLSNLYSVLNLVVMPIGVTNHFDLVNKDNKSFFEVKFDNIKSDNFYPIKKANDSLGVDISADSALVKDLKTSRILFEKNKDEKRSIASITKLMSAIVLLDMNIDKNKVISFSQKPSGDFDKLKLNVYDKIRFEDLFNSSIIVSSNSGIEILIANSGISRDEFIDKMNKKAKEFGLQSTIFKDPTGLNNDNVSTANEVLIFAQHAFKHQEIKDLTSKKAYSFSPVDSDRMINIKNTNELIGGYLTIEAGKTGTTDDAGFCLVSEISYDNRGPVLAVVLGSKSHLDRFYDLKAISSWVFENYNWK